MRLTALSTVVVKTTKPAIYEFNVIVMINQTRTCGQSRATINTTNYNLCHIRTFTLYNYKAYCIAIVLRKALIGRTENLALLQIMVMPAYGI